MKKKELAKKDLIALIVVAIGMVIALMAIVGFNKVQESKLLANTPLNEYTFYTSLDNFPKYKLEAAEMVDELMSEGTAKEEACQLAINETSDKIYKDTVEYYENHEGSTHEQFAEYVNKMQK